MYNTHSSLILLYFSAQMPEDLARKVYLEFMNLHPPDIAELPLELLG